MNPSLTNIIQHHTTGCKAGRDRRNNVGGEPPSGGPAETSRTRCCSPGWHPSGGRGGSSPWWWRGEERKWNERSIKFDLNKHRGQLWSLKQMTVKSFSSLTLIKIIQVLLSLNFFKSNFFWNWPGLMIFSCVWVLVLQVIVGEGVVRCRWWWDIQTTESHNM